MTAPVTFVDIDDTLIRTYGSKRLVITETVRFVRWAKAAGHLLYCWSSGGAEYARASAAECGIEDCFLAFLPKPNLLVDDQKVDEWRRTVALHPNECTEERVKAEFASRGIA